jgi:hypothetical protein
MLTAKYIVLAVTGQLICVIVLLGAFRKHWPLCGLVHGAKFCCMWFVEDVVIRGPYEQVQNLLSISDLKDALLVRGSRGRVYGIMDIWEDGAKPFGLSCYPFELTSGGSANIFEGRITGHQDATKDSVKGWRLPIVNDSYLGLDWVRCMHVVYKIKGYRFNPRPLILMKLVNGRLDAVMGILLVPIHRASHPVDIANGAPHLLRGLFTTSPHLIKLSLHDNHLAVVYRQRPNSDSSQNNLARKIPNLKPVKFLFGICLNIVGFACALIGHYALLWKCNDWGWRKRFVIGISSWSLAVILISHGASVLLNT